MTWLDSGGQRSRSQQAVEVVKAAHWWWGVRVYFLVHFSALALLVEWSSSPYKWLCHLSTKILFWNKKRKKNGEVTGCPISTGKTADDVVVVVEVLLWQTWYNWVNETVLQAPESVRCLCAWCSGEWNQENGVAVQRRLDTWVSPLLTWWTGLDSRRSVFVWRHVMSCRQWLVCCVHSLRCRRRRHLYDCYISVGDADIVAGVTEWNGAMLPSVA